MRKQPSRHPRSDEMKLVALFVARFSDRSKSPPKPPAELKAGTLAAGFTLFFSKLGEGRTLEEFVNSIRTFCDYCLACEAGTRRFTAGHLPVVEPWLVSARQKLWNRIKPFCDVDSRASAAGHHTILNSQRRPTMGQTATTVSRQNESEMPSTIKRGEHAVASVKADLSRIAQAVEEEGYFSPGTLHDERERRLRAIVQRYGQPEFRTKLIKAYQRRCAVTGCDAVDALEAAHIVAYCGPQSNHISNGILLRADVHTLFDLDLIGVDPKTLSVRLAPELHDTIYVELHGKPLSLPTNSANKPNRQAIAKRWERFQRE